MDKIDAGCVNLVFNIVRIPGGLRKNSLPLMASSGGQGE